MKVIQLIKNTHALFLVISQQKRKSKERTLYQLMASKEIITKRFEARRALKKYQIYFDQYPIDLIFRCRLIEDEHHTDGTYDYFGSQYESMRHGSYGICLKIHQNKVLTIYQGRWMLDQQHGYGSFHAISHPQNQNKIYRLMEGQWEKGKLNGKGWIKNYQIKTKKWEIAYQGDFVKGERHGEGVEKNDGVLFRGHFENGCRTGQGRLSDQKGNFIDGKFEKGMIKGEHFAKRGGSYIFTNEQDKKEVFFKRKDEDILQIINYVSTK